MRRLLCSGALIGAIFSLAPTATAQQNAERESLEALRQTTLALIDLLVQNGTLSRDKADALLAEARRKALQGSSAAATTAPAAAGAS